MNAKTLLIIIFTIISIAQTDAVCIPCPREGVTLSSFSNCNCRLPKFYNEKTKKCVLYTDCPLPEFRNPFPELKALAPDLHDSLSNILETLDPKVTKIPKDLKLAASALRKRIENVKKSLPSLLGPIIGTVALKNNDLFEKCGGNMGCLIRGTLKREENYDYIFPKLKPVFDKVIRMLHGVFDDLKEVAEEKCGKEHKDCPLIDGLIKIRELVPANLQEFMDMQQIAIQINKYFMKDIKKQINSVE